MKAVVQAKNLTKRFGEFTAVDGITFDIPQGICFGLLGPNGAGKTTAIRMIQAVSPRTDGTLTVLGHDTATHGRAIRGLLGVVPQEDNLDPDFTVRDNLRIYARFYNVPAAVANTRADEMLGFMNLAEKRDARIDELSGGMKRRLVVARSLMNDPELLVLDEPTTGLDPQARHALWNTIRGLRRKGKTILLTTHYMDEAEMLCDELVVMDKGKILERGNPPDLITKHCGTEAVEFVTDDDAQQMDAIATQLEGTPYERLPDRIIAYGTDLAGLQSQVRETHGVTQSILRRATLEDVFLRLTGRALRD